MDSDIQQIKKKGESLTSEIKELRKKFRNEPTEIRKGNEAIKGR